MTDWIGNGTPVTPGVATFDPALGDPRDKVRLLLGDTDTDAALLDDATIDAMLDANTYRTAVAVLAQGLINRFSQEPESFKAGQISLSWGARISAWQELIKQMQVGAGGLAVAPTTIQDTAPRTGRTGEAAQDKATAVMTNFRSD